MDIVETSAHLIGTFIGAGLIAGLLYLLVCFFYD